MPCTSVNTATSKLPVSRPLLQGVPLFDGLMTLLTLFSQLRERQRQLQALLELDDHLLNDIGLDRKRVEQIGRKRFWE